MTLGCLRAIRECDVKCPEELALISFDDLEWFEFTHPSVTAVVQNAYELGAGAAQILANRLAGKLTGPPWR
jgi:LacI family transcriptional regulator